MIVIMVSDCPPKIRGDLSKWLFDINTGVFVGNVSSRVRDEIWDRVCNNIKNGQATMVFSAQGEQKMDFRVHNTSWEPVDFDGIKLMRRPFLEKRNVQNDVTERKESKSRAERLLIADRMKRAQAKKHFQEGYVVLDVETTGTSLHSDEIIEIGALRVEAGIPTKEFSTLVQCEKKIPKEVQMLTGLTNCDLDDNGKPLKQALEELFVFAGEHIIIGHNVTFDYNFIRSACQKQGMEMRLGTLSRDTLALARRKIRGVEDYQLVTLMKHLGYDVSKAHRALADCYLTYQLYKKLNEI